jgi:hypothetical protein
VFQYFPHSPGVPDWLPPAVSVHREEWKLIRIFHGGENGAHRYMLFNLLDDIGERNNLATNKPELVKELDKLIEDFLVRTNAVVPVPNPAFNPSRYNQELEGKPAPRGNKKPKGAPAAPVKSSESNSPPNWRSSKDVVFIKNDKHLTFQSTGGDPWISTRAIPEASGPFTVTLRLSSTGKGAGAIFFMGKNDKNFLKDRSIDFPIVHDGKLHQYTIEVPANDLSALRLDSGVAPGEFNCEQFDLRDSTGKSSSLLK